ncbi:LisH domain-containing protein FOPNL [Gryllus bimaculatus]|nr:LisH domain-containing protein FOPNL [Gryllus bimaculatus]
MASEEQLFEALKESLEKSGQLGRMKGEIRAEIFNALHRGGVKPQMPKATLAVNELIREYLDWSGYHYSSAVLVAESGLPDQPIGRPALMEDLGVIDTEETKQFNDLDIQSGYDFNESSEQLYDRKYKNVLYQSSTKPQISSGMPQIESSTADENNVGRGKGDDVLKVLTDNVSMDEFMANVASQTGDGGCTFKDVLCDELSIFNAFVKNVFDNQHEDISHLLDQEEISLRERYEQWTRMIKNRSNRVKNFLKEILPNCSWEDYKRKYGSQIRMQTWGSSDCGPEGDFNAWRQESFLKLLFLEDEAKKLQFVPGKSETELVAREESRSLGAPTSSLLEGLQPVGSAHSEASDENSGSFVVPRPLPRCGAYFYMEIFPRQ